MDSDKVKIREVLTLMRSYKISILGILAMSLGFAFSLSSFMEKQYKSQFEINIYSKYFQNPLISEIVPGTYNIPQMRFTIDSMIKEAVSDDYLDQLAQEYEIYSVNEPEENVAKNRQFFRDRFKFYSTGGQSYRVSYKDPDAYRAKKIAEGVMDRVKGHFINTRIASIETVKGIMLDRLQSLSASEKMGTSGTQKALASRSPEVLSAELSKINANISALSKQYNMNHPKLVELISRKRTVTNWLKEFKTDLGSMSEGDSAIAMPMNKEINGVLTGKFFAKYHDFNMALDIEKRSLESYFGIIERPQLPTEPVWPKKRLFAILGFLIGLVFAFLYVFVKELMLPSKIEMVKSEAERLGIPYIGEFRSSAIGRQAKEGVSGLNPQVANR